jgi:hypothetical protein
MPANRSKPILFDNLSVCKSIKMLQSLSLPDEKVYFIPAFITGSYLQVCYFAMASEGVPA